MKKSNLIQKYRLRYKNEKKPNDTVIWFFFRILLSKIPFFNKVKLNKLKEKRCSYGKEDKDVVYYIIRPASFSAGLMSLYNYVVEKINYAEKNNYIPIVNFRDYKNMYLYNNHKHRINSWEYWFLQPTNKDLSCIKKAKNVIICSTIDYRGYGSIEQLKNDDYILECNSIIKKYIRFNKETSDYIENELNLLIGKKKILGVKARGTDYLSLQPRHHSKVPSAEELCDIVERKMEEWGDFEGIFLATEDELFLQCFLKKFGNKIITNDCNRYESNTKNKEIAQVFRGKHVDLKMEGLQYLTSVYLLSKCDSLITPKVGAGVVAIKMNGCNYRNVYIYDDGTY